MTKNLINLTGKVATVRGAGSGHKPKTEGPCKRQQVNLCPGAGRDLAAAGGMM